MSHFICLLALAVGQFTTLGFTQRPQEKAEGELYFSPRKGSTWLYDVNGKEETHEVVTVKQKGSSKIVDVEVRDAKGKVVRKIQYEVNDTGIVQLGARTADLMHPTINARLLLLPSKLNQKWEVEVGHAIKDSYIDRGAETVQVGTEGFKALRVSESHTSIYFEKPILTTYWYAPGVGLVKKEVSWPTNERPVEVMTLKSFKKGDK